MSCARDTPVRATKVKSESESDTYIILDCFYAVGCESCHVLLFFET